MRPLSVTAMNDPHVVSLTYRINTSETVDFHKAPPCHTDQGAFRVTLDAYKARVEMVDHFASVKEAREFVRPFLRAWELQADLQDSSDRFRFEFETAEVVDRSPPDGSVVTLQTGMITVAGMDAVIHIGRGKWPDPPQELQLSPDVDTLWRRWWRHREEKREPLLAAAYWALTMREAAPGLTTPAKPRPSSRRRQAASAFFNIDFDVLNMIGELTSERGGNDEERKAEGRATPLSPVERQWLEAAFRELVRRVAERAYQGKPPSRQLTMRDLPQLTP
jgi:hypothetical protein